MTLVLSALLLLCCAALVWQGILIRAQRRDIGDLTRRINELYPPEKVLEDFSEATRAAYVDAALQAKYGA